MGGGRGGGGQKRGRTQRRHFRNHRDNVWKKNKSDDSTATTTTTTTTSTWGPFATQNLAFENYYKEQSIVAEDEWDAFLEILLKPLPAAFRINSSAQFFEDIRSQLETDFMNSLNAEVVALILLVADSGEADAIRPLPWYPDNLAWHSNFSRMQLRKNQTLERFHEFLKRENETGNITRQEAVSMVPPLFLDVHPEHFLLDMCAAPGSKTFQLLEMIHQSTEFGLLPAGMVIANDLDVQRCNLLIHQTKRMCSANLIVTNHEAQHFPSCRVKDVSEMETGEGRINELMFDRVLCDVPCSGDGTLRKAPDIWRKWNAGMGNGLHRLQVQIAMRGLALLKVGGRMVYSTCSMNPVENEAVVAEVLRRSGESIELLDVSIELPELIRRPGIKKWKVRDRGLWLASYKDVPKHRRGAIVPSMFPSGRTYDVETAPDNLEEVNPPESNQENANPSSLEKTPDNGNNVDSEQGLEQLENLATPSEASELEVSDLPLERCMRILPHDQNTGAFFIAVFQKLSSAAAVDTSHLSGQLTKRQDELPNKLADGIIEDAHMLEIEPPVDDANDQQSICSEAASDADLADKSLKEDTLKLDSSGICEENEADATETNGEIENKSEMSKGGKRKLQMQGRWRGVDPVVLFQDEATISSIRAFYGISESFPFEGQLVARNDDAQRVKRIYYISKSVQNVLKLNLQVGQQLKITSIGLKTFERQTSKEGTSTKCGYRVSSEGLPLLLPYITKQILYASLADFKHLLQYRTIKFADFVDSKFGEKASELMEGCCVIVLNHGAQASPLPIDASTIAIGCWKGKTNVSAMVSPTDSQELLERLCVHLEKKGNSLAQENNHCDSMADAEEAVATS
ncbi:hypothetical protein Sjap_010588 [Stephania japonica]|uniref:SAM-dependent MTase RsmB/NOP-type domain-containing protein n=1 Tax=Stephania japonica TaxID=461633 RepID=A0AAP0J9Q2_9MAGN